MARGKPIPALGKPLFTPRFELRPVSRMRMFLMQRRAMADAELRGLFLQEAEAPSAWRTWRRIRRLNGRTRFAHAIIDRASGETIGYHRTGMIGYRTAGCEVMIFDKRWWGRGVVIETRKALFVAFYDHAGVRQFSSQVHSRNFASILNHRKLGMEHTGTMYMMKLDEFRNEPADYVLFSIRGERLADKIEEWRHELG